LHTGFLVAAVVVGAVVGIAAGFAITPTYTAEAQLAIGKSLNLTNTAAITGLPVAEETLAEDYSRLADTPTVSRDVDKSLGYQPSGTLSASPLADSPVIAVYGSGSSRAAALALASAGSRALISAINTVNQQTTDANQTLLAQYQTDSETEIADQQAVDELQSQVGAQNAAAGSETGAAQAAAQALAHRLSIELIVKEATLQSDNLKLTALENQYEAVFNPNLAIEQTVTQLGGATSQGDNRTSSLEIGGIAGIVVGMVLGLAWAARQEYRVNGRKVRAASEAPQVA
jgi:hypothetical protein